MGLLSFTVPTVVMGTIWPITDKYKICKLGKHTWKECKQSDSEWTKQSKQSANEGTSVSLVVQKYKINILV